MKLRSKIAASFALLGAVSMAHAESITFGVEVPPIASLVVRDGMVVNASTLYKVAAVDATAAQNEVVGGFALVTNMPKWNIYFGFAHGGKLQSQSGSQIKDNKGNPLWLGTSGGAAPGATDATAFLVTAEASSVKATDGTNGIGDLNSQAIVSSPFVSPTQNTLTKALTAPATACFTGLTGAAPLLACSFATPWLQSFDQTTTNFDIRTAMSSITSPVLTTPGNLIGSVAGTYTETMYLTLVTSY
jgi:hypothetical protein